MRTSCGHETSRRLRVGAALLALLLPVSAGARVIPSTLDRLIGGAELIALVRVTDVSGDVAHAVVMERLKGVSPDSLSLDIRRDFACDITTAEAGETALMFLRPGEQGLYTINYVGRGRMPVREINGLRYVTIWVIDVRLPEGMPTIPGPYPEYGFVRSVHLEDIRDRIRTLGDGEAMSSATSGSGNGSE